MIGNTNTKVLHLEGCKALDMMNEKHKEYTTSGLGFRPCHWCKPHVQSVLPPVKKRPEPDLPDVPPVYVTCHFCQQDYDETTVKCTDIMEDDLGRDVVLFDCPECGASVKSFRVARYYPTSKVGD